jgi:hypothetical protein
MRLPCHNIVVSFVELCKRGPFGDFDGQQIYGSMPIGTAKPGGIASCSTDADSKAPAQAWMGLITVTPGQNHTHRVASSRENGTRQI